MSAWTGLEAAQAIADALLYRGYQLHPYLSDLSDLADRSTSGGPAGLAGGPVLWPAERLGILVPPAFADADAGRGTGTAAGAGNSADAGLGTHVSCRTECLLEREPGADVGLVADPDEWADLGVLHAQVRFLRLVDQAVWVRRREGRAAAEAIRAPAGSPGQPGGWVRAVACEEDALVPLADLLVGPADPEPDPELWTIPVSAPAGREAERLPGPPVSTLGEQAPAGAERGPRSAGAQEVPASRWVVSVRQRIDAELRLSARWLPGPFRVARLCAELRNTSRWTPGPAAEALAPAGATARGSGPREALRRSLIAAHLVFRAPGWRFLSLADPPWWAATYAACCRNEHAWPVLVGGAPCHDDTVLAAPLVLPDHPRPAQAPGVMPAGAVGPGGARGLLAAPTPGRVVPISGRWL